MNRLNEEQRKQVSEFLADQRKRFTQEQWSESYQSWAKGGNAWDRIMGLGGTDTQSALTWYQHFHRPGSKEWRPSIIVRDLLIASCPHCGGDGVTDSGGVTPWGEWINVPCICVESLAASP